MKYFAGIDIGSTASKVVVLDGSDMVDHFVLPTGWSSKETAGEIARRLEAGGHPVGDDMKVIATGYGRVAVDYAAKTVTEITCHGRGGRYLLGRDCTIVDIGGQDTKVITVENGMPTSFLMNDKSITPTERCRDSPPESAIRGQPSPPGAPRTESSCGSAGGWS